MATKRVQRIGKCFRWRGAHLQVLFGGPSNLYVCVVYRGCITSGPREGQGLSHMLLRKDQLDARKAIKGGCK